MERNERSSIVFYNRTIIKKRNHFSLLHQSLTLLSIIIGGFFLLLARGFLLSH